MDILLLNQPLLFSVLTYKMFSQIVKWNRYTLQCQNYMKVLYFIVFCTSVTNIYIYSMVQSIPRKFDRHLSVWKIPFCYETRRFTTITTVGSQSSKLDPLHSTLILITCFQSYISLLSFHLCLLIPSVLFLLSSPATLFAFPAPLWCKCAASVTVLYEEHKLWCSWLCKFST